MHIHSDSQALMRFAERKCKHGAYNNLSDGMSDSGMMASERGRELLAALCPADQRQSDAAIQIGQETAPIDVQKTYRSACDFVLLLGCPE